MTTATITVHQLITDVLSEFNGSDVNEDDAIAAVVDRTSEEFVWAFYRDAVAPLVRNRFRNRATSALRNVFHPRGVAMPGGTRSTKVRQKQDAWQKVLDERWSVNGKPMRLGDCGVDELDLLIANRESHIAAVGVSIERLRRVKKMLETYAADKVDEIPPTVGQQFLEEKK
jgi:hypothetical protein